MTDLETTVEETTTETTSTNDGTVSMEEFNKMKEEMAELKAAKEKAEIHKNGLEVALTKERKKGNAAKTEA